ncbi:MAG: MFS transporter [Pyrinomonadaceae bacterium]|nr:MFS transporter [Pyrinomonadaceae bacterium]
MSFGFLGIQIGFGLQQANMSPIYKYLGAEESTLPYLWLAGPVTGLLIQPIIGAMSDRTWNSLGRRRPYFLIGAILASICLILMPYSSALWMAASLLWILDFSINTSMEPFRAFVGDKLPEEQRTLGFVMQSFFIGIGQTLANAAPFLFGVFGVVGTMASGIPNATLYSFVVGAFFFLTAVLWTVVSSKEYPPENIEEFRRKQADTTLFGVIGEIVKEITDAIRQMPVTMQRLAIVQFFTWFALPCMWQFYGLTVARHVYLASDEKSQSFIDGTNWGGLSFAVYNVVCFAVAFILPSLAKLISRKGLHALCLTLGGLGLVSTAFATDKYFLWVGMAGVGIAWASILSMPYVILAGAIKPERMGVYMGVFNLFIVLPQIVMSFVIPQIYNNILNKDPLNVVILGGIVMLIAAASVFFVRDVGLEKASVETVAAD